MTCVQEARLSEEGTMAKEAVMKFDEKRRHERYHKKLWMDKERSQGTKEGCKIWRIVKRRAKDKVEKY
jgi:hypothetical protein